MNKKLIIGIVAVLLIVIGAGAYMFLGNKSSDTSNSEKTQMETDSSMQTTDGPKSFRDLIGFANNQMCTFADAESSSEGTVYVAGGKVRGDFSSKTETETSLSHMISDGSDFYVWLDGSEEGFKGNLDAMSKASAEGTDPNTKSLDPDKKVDYKCESWSVDNSKFDLPNIEFTDYSSLMMSIPSGMPSVSDEDTKASQCAACDNLPADSQAQCKQLLSC